jgi:hypothetical protein
MSETMSASDLSPGCTAWRIGDATMHPPADRAFLEAVYRSGFLAFTGPSGLCGAKSAFRSVVLVHRGRGTRWEIVFREQESDVVTTTTTDLAKTTATALSWLRGGALFANEDSLHAKAG